MDLLEEEDAETGILFPTLSVGLEVNRHHQVCTALARVQLCLIVSWLQFYHWNVIFPIFMFVTIPFITVLMEPDDLNGRLEV